MLSGEWQVYEKHWTWDTCYICVVFKGRCFTVESTFKNIRPVSWSQQDTSPCLICDFMQHFIYCLLHFMLLFIYVFSFFSLVLLSSSLGFDASIRKNLWRASTNPLITRNLSFVPDSCTSNCEPSFILTIGDVSASFSTKWILRIHHVPIIYPRNSFGLLPLPIRTLFSLLKGFFILEWIIMSSLVGFKTIPCRSRFL